VGPEVKSVGKPCARNPHARFDERGWETERWYRLRHRHRAKAAGNSYSLCPHVTAPILDSTVSTKKGRAITDSAFEHFNQNFNFLLLVNDYLSSRPITFRPVCRGIPDITAGPYSDLKSVYARPRFIAVTRPNLRP